MSKDSLSDHLEVPGGILAQVEAMKHLSVVLSEMLQARLASPRHDGGDAPYVEVTFSVDEIDRIIWLSGEMFERGRTLSGQVEALYDDLCEMTHQQAQAGRKAA